MRLSSDRSRHGRVLACILATFRLTRSRRGNTQGSCGNEERPGTRWDTVNGGHAVNRTTGGSRAYAFGEDASAPRTEGRPAAGRRFGPTASSGANWRWRDRWRAAARRAARAARAALAPPPPPRPRDAHGAWQRQRAGAAAADGVRLLLLMRLLVLRRRSGRRRAVGTGAASCGRCGGGAAPAGIALATRAANCWRMLTASRGHRGKGLRSIVLESVETRARPLS